MSGTKEFRNPCSLERATLNASSALTADVLSFAIFSQPNRTLLACDCFWLDKEGRVLMLFLRSTLQSTRPIAGASSIASIGIDQLRKLIQLQIENKRLKRVFSDLTLDKLILR